MKYPHLSKAIQKLLPDAHFVLSGFEGKESYEKIQWVVGQDYTNQNLFGEPDFEIPSWEEVEKVWNELKAEYATFEYQRKRKPEYPAIEDQLDLLYHKGVEGWKEEIQKVKDKYPKPVVEEPVVEEPIVEEPKVEEPKVEKPIVWHEVYGDENTKGGSK